MPVPTLPSMPSSDGDGLPQFKAVSLDGPRTRRGLVINPNVAFFLRHHPSAWEVETEGLDSPMFLPQLTRFWLLPGANGVRTVSEDEDDVDAYRVAMQEASAKGWVFLDPGIELPADMRPPETSPSGYLVAAECRQPGTNAKGTYHDEVWNRPLSSVPGERGGFRFHRGPYNRWRAHLVKSGVIAPPAERTMDALRRRYQTHVERIEVQPLPDEVRKRRVKDAKAIAKVFETANAPSVQTDETGAKTAPNGGSDES